MRNQFDYSQLFFELPALAILLDARGRFIDVSDKWSRRTGYSREELLGKRPEDIATSESGHRIRAEHLPGFKRTGRLDHVPVEFLAKSGEVLELLATARAKFNNRKRHLYSIVIFIETNGLARAERRYEDLYHSTPAMLHTIDVNGSITDVSDHWLEKLGYERKEVIGKSILDFLSKASRKHLDGGIREIIASGDHKNVPRQMVSKDEEILDVVMSAHTELDKSKGLKRLLVASKDMTARNRGEEKLRAAYGEIARLKEELELERDYLREEVQVSMNFSRIVGESPALGGMLARIEAVADTPASVLIIGETGTGKELVAHAIHSRSRRAEEPLVKVNCASISDELFESEFFGHVKGAFTGAHRDRVGRFQLADGGTIFLDEVSEIPLVLQSKLLRVLQEQEFERVGDDLTRKVDVRVIAATNRDLEQEVERGNFREDLYYRLSVFPVQVPPLSRRGDDVIQLAYHFLEKICRDFGRTVPSFTQRQVEEMREYDWPGNIRELKNLIERAIILSPIESARIDLSIPQTIKVSDQNEMLSNEKDLVNNFYTEEEMKKQIKDNLRRALNYVGWRISGPNGAARLLGISPSTLTDRIRSYELEKPAGQRRGRPSS
ncbi:MAG: sigma 54-interacting transcriptional regulator [Pseudomonadota bacterium]|nr:sigma 54-interacting transcriptional regulator [Pseudomonadota bacterium]